jgi:hypothetical protein
MVAGMGVLDAIRKHWLTLLRFGTAKGGRSRTTHGVETWDVRHWNTYDRDVAGPRSRDEENPDLRASCV